MRIRYSKYSLYGVLIALLLIVLDQYSKNIILQNIQPENPLQVTSFFNIVFVLNKGISFGILGHNVPIPIDFLLPVLLSFIVAILVIWLLRTSEKITAIGLGFIVGGAIGNLCDRFWHGAVIDFLDFHVNAYHWPAFNIADSCIFIGVVIFLFSNILSANHSPEASQNEKKPD